MKLEELKMYLVRNSSGSYYRRVGYGGYGECWTDDVAKASIWTKLSTARSRVTYFASHYPDFPIPELIVVSAGEVTVMDETARVEKARAKIKKDKEEQEVRQRQYAVERAQEQLDDAQRRLKKLRGDD
jgi:hypothetical protein